MQKNKNGRERVALFGTLRVMVSVSLLVAMSIVCGKYLAFGVGNVLRFSFENLPILLSGIFFGPIIGAVTGVAADLIGCFMVGYAVNPLVTLGAAAIGITSGLIFGLLKKRERICRSAAVTLTVSAAHVVGSVLVKTAGLAAFYDMPFGILMRWRLLNYAIIGAVESVMIYYVTKNKAVSSLIAGINRRKTQ